MLLAPVVRERKGEHVQVFEQLRAQGFVRVRVDGVLHEIDAVPPLALRQKHTIEAVIDRFKPRATTSSSAWPNPSRPRSSSATAWRSVQAHGRRRTRAPLLFSSKFSCPVCDYSLPELEPRLFSFNSPMGACPACDGLGVSRVLRSRARGRASGAVAGRRRGARLGPPQRLLLPADRLAGASTTASTSTRRGRSCDEEQRQAVLYGSGDEVDHLHLPHRSRRAHASASTSSKASCPNLERRYQETESPAVQRRTGEVHQRRAPARNAAARA